MNPGDGTRPGRSRRVLGNGSRSMVGPLAFAVALIALVGWMGFGSAAAQPAAAGPSWASLSAPQQKALEPLRPTWDTNDASRKKKWIEVAERFPQMPAEERLRVQERMAAWAAMSPAERARARLQFQETRRLGPEERQARWQAYQSLPEEERQRLANAGADRGAAVSGTAGASPARSPATPAGPASSSVGAKRNVVAAAPVPAPRAVAPTMVQAKPGATTTTVATPAKPPLHHQPGLPKIVATPAFVDPTTLLPRRGPQAAAMRTAASSDPTQQP